MWTAYRINIFENFKTFRKSSLDMLRPLDPVRDLRLSGQVIYTGRSSIEVAVKMEALGNDDAEETIMLGRINTVYVLFFGSNILFQVGSLWFAETRKLTGQEM